MPRGLNRVGDFFRGFPITLPHNFGNLITEPHNFGNIIGGTTTSGFELEDGSGVILLEDGTSVLLLEIQ
jgi:hypothetical protein